MTYPNMSPFHQRQLYPNDDTEDEQSITPIGAINYSNNGLQQLRPQQHESVVVFSSIADSSQPRPLEAQLVPDEDEVENRIAQRVREAEEEFRQRANEERRRANIVDASAVEVNPNTDVDDKDSDRPCGGSCTTRQLIIIGLVTVLLVFGGVAAVVVVVLGGEEKVPLVETTSPTTTPPTTSPTPSPSVSPTTHAPSAQPTDPPTNFPTEAPFSPRFLTLFERLELEITINGHLLLDETSTQHASLLWLADEDPAQLDLEFTPTSILLQRYVMVLFHMMTGGKVWRDQSNFLERFSVCDWNNGLSGDDERGVVCDRLSVTEIQLGKSEHAPAMDP